MEPVAGNPHGGFCEGGWAQERSSRPIPTHHNLRHDLVLKAVRHHTEAESGLKWIPLYVERWLQAPLQLEDGTLRERTAGTPQGGVVTPPTMLQK